MTNDEGDILEEVSIEYHGNGSDAEVIVPNSQFSNSYVDPNGSNFVCITCDKRMGANGEEIYFHPKYDNLDDAIGIFFCSDTCCKEYYNV